MGPHKEIRDVPEQHVHMQTGAGEGTAQGEAPSADPTDSKDKTQEQT